MAWTVETLNGVVDAELEALPADMRARFHHISNLIEEFGLDRVREPHVKHLHGPLWEMRLSGARRHLASHLCDRHPPASGGGESLRQEDREDSSPGD